MVCRGTVVADPPLSMGGLEADSTFGESPSRTAPQSTWASILFAIVIVTFLLSRIPGRFELAPRVESDYAYQLIAADRLHEGHGLTSLQPIAPRQPWSWEYDFGYLTQWPAGYSILVASVRWCLNCATIRACQWISTVAAAIAMVGWFAWTRECVPRGVCGFLIACAAAGLSVNMASFVNPSTDLMVVAALPFILRLATRRRVGSSNLVCAGFAAGLLFWFRYASLFVPAALSIWLIIERLARSRFTWRQVTWFVISAAIPIIGLLITHHFAVPSASLQSRLNLGHQVTLNASFTHLATAWWNLTNLGYYNHRAAAHWVFALWPVVGIGLVLMFRPIRLIFTNSVRSPMFSMALVVTTTLAAMLVIATTLFAEKYDYINLARYYAPVIPLYFTLWVAPVVCGAGRPIRFVLSIGLLLACSWTVKQSWIRDYHRDRDAAYETTDFGQCAVAFTPGAAELYRWLSQQDSRDWIILSNFHEYITLETGIPALPVPSDRATLDSWIPKIAEHRGIQNPRILFILDPDQRWRTQYFQPVEKMIKGFNLHRTWISDNPGPALILEYATLSSKE